MAYSRSAVTVERMMPYLEPLAQGRSCIWRTAPNRSVWFAGKVREALDAARVHADRYPELAVADFRIEVTSSREVQAVPKESNRVQLIGEVRTQQPVVIAPIESIEDVIAEWQRAKTSKLYLPDTRLSEEDLLRLYSWTQAEGLMFFENTGALTLMPADPETLPFAWNPDEEL